MTQLYRLYVLLCLFLCVVGFFLDLLTLIFMFYTKHFSALAKCDTNKSAYVIGKGWGNLCFWIFLKIRWAVAAARVFERGHYSVWGRDAARVEKQPLITSLLLWQPTCWDAWRGCQLCPPCWVTGLKFTRRLSTVPVRAAVIQRGLKRAASF